MTLDVIAAAQRRTRRVTLVAVAAVAVMAGLAIGLGRHVRAHPDAAPPTTAEATNPAGTLPADVTWTRLAGVDLPLSPTTGPWQQRDGLAGGFSHTPAGAVVAAVHLLVRTTAEVGPAMFGPTLADQVVGEHAAAMRTAVAVEYRDRHVGPGDDSLGDLPAAITSVRVDRYTDADVALAVLTTTTGSVGQRRFAVTTVTVAWVDGDWRLVAPPDGRWDTQVRLVNADQVANYPLLRRG